MFLSLSLSLSVAMVTMYCRNESVTYRDNQLHGLTAELFTLQKSIMQYISNSMEQSKILNGRVKSHSASQ